MQYQFSIERDCLRAELVGRETAEETEAFLRAMVEEARRAQLPRLLIVVRRSRPIFKVGGYGIGDYLKQLAAVRGARVALVGDSSEIHAAHQYIEVLAAQQGASVRAFREEQAALEWLNAGSAAAAK